MARDGNRRRKAPGGSSPPASLVAGLVDPLQPQGTEGLVVDPTSQRKGSPAQNQEVSGHNLSSFYLPAKDRQETPFHKSGSIPATSALRRRLTDESPRGHGNLKSPPPTSVVQAPVASMNFVTKGVPSLAGYLPEEKKKEGVQKQLTRAMCFEHPMTNYEHYEIEMQERYRRTYYKWERRIRQTFAGGQENNRPHYILDPPTEAVDYESVNKWQLEMAGRLYLASKKGEVVPPTDTSVSANIYEKMLGEQPRRMWQNPFYVIAKLNRVSFWDRKDFDYTLVKLPNLLGGSDSEPFYGAIAMWKSAISRLDYEKSVATGVLGSDEDGISDSLRFAMEINNRSPRISYDWAIRGADAFLRKVKLNKPANTSQDIDVYDWERRCHRLLFDSSSSVQGRGKVGGVEVVPESVGYASLGEGASVDPGEQVSIARNCGPGPVSTPRVVAQVAKKRKVSLARQQDLSSNKSHPNEHLCGLFKNTPRVSGRVNPSQVRDNRRMTPSHPQILQLVSKLIPHPLDIKFEKKMGDYMGGILVDDSELPGDVRIGSTPLQWLDSSFRHATDEDHRGEYPSSVTAIDLVNCNPFAHSNRPRTTATRASKTEFHLLEVILNRRVKPIKALKDRSLDAAQVRHVVALNNAHMGDEFDDMYKAYIVVSLKAGLAYCNKEYYKSGTGRRIKSRGHVPIGLSWFGFDRHGLPQRSSYIKSMIRGWTFTMYDMHYGDDVPVFSNTIWAKQTTDMETPPLAPDVYEGEDVSKLDQVALKAKYFEALKNSNSRRLRGRHFVRGAHHHAFPDSVLIVDPRGSEGNVDIVVAVHQASLSYGEVGEDGTPLENPIQGGRRAVESFQEDGVEFKAWKHTNIQELSTISVRNMDNSETKPLLDKLNQNAFESVCATVKNTGPQGSCRNGSGDRGVMIPMGVGLHDYLSSEEWTYNSNANAPSLPDAADASARLGNAYFPTVLRAMQQTEIDVGIREPTDFFRYPDTGEHTVERRNSTAHSAQQEEEEHRHPSFMAVSCNLQNASHFDPGDGNVGYVIWTCKHGSDDVDNWYFIFPNLIGKRADGTTFNGVAVRLYHGVGIAFDGRVIRHCTSVTDNVRIPQMDKIGVTPHVFGTFAGTNIDYIERIRQSTLEEHESRVARREGTNAVGGIAGQVKPSTEVGLNTEKKKKPRRKRKRKDRR
jgi:hypothetical protein